MLTIILICEFFDMRLSWFNGSISQVNRNESRTIYYSLARQLRANRAIRTIR